MNFVQPIRDPRLVEDIANYLKKKNDRDYIMFIIGIYLGRRISDILNLKVEDVKNKNYLKIKERKTGKHVFLEFNPKLKKVLDEYTKELDPDDYLIKSRQGYNRPIDRTTAYRILREAAFEFRLEDRIGTHTMRKTFGYHYYKQTKDIVTLQEIFGHSHPSITLRYIGINNESINNALKKFSIF